LQNKTKQNKTKTAPLDLSFPLPCFFFSAIIYSAIFTSLFRMQM
jgi:hypothetical protein